MNYMLKLPTYLFCSLHSKSEIEPLFKNADPDGDGHVSLEDGAKILAQNSLSCRQMHYREFQWGKKWTFMLRFITACIPKDAGR